MITITVCIGSSCHLKGSYNIVNELEKLIHDNNLEDRVKIKSSFCLGECAKTVSVKIDDGSIISVSKETIIDFFNEFIVKKL